VAEPKTRTRRIRFPAPEGCTDLTALDEAPLRQPRVDMGEHRLRGLAVDVGEYPLRQFPMEMPCKSKSHRPAKSHLRWIQYLFVLVGLMGAGVYGWLYAEARVYQAYESWRLNQIQQGLCQTQLGPASDGSAEGCPSAATVPPRPERGPDHPSSASGATRIGDGLARGGNRILYQLEMPLRDIYPPIWLRIQLWENETLTELRTERDRVNARIATALESFMDGDD
jgi:hypothetical protein